MNAEEDVLLEHGNAEKVDGTVEDEKLSKKDKTTLVTKTDKLKSQIYMLIVAILWGSYVPLLKFLYLMEDHPSVSAYTATHLTIAWLFLSSTTKIGTIFQHSEKNGSQVSKYKQKQKERKWIPGLELAVWETSATICQTMGVSRTTSLHAGIIICLATAFVPLVSWLVLRERPKAIELFSCLIAMMGAAFVTLDTSGSTHDASNEAMYNIMIGDAITCVAALGYAIAMVRIHARTKEQDSVDLAVWKVFFGATLASTWALGEGAVDGNFVHLWPGVDNIQQWTLIFVISLGPSALSNVLQTKALSVLKPSEGQLILASVPIWTVFMTMIALEDEPLGVIGWGGVLLVVSSVIFANTQEDTTQTIV